MSLNHSCWHVYNLSDCWPTCLFLVILCSHISAVRSMQLQLIAMMVKTIKKGLKWAASSSVKPFTPKIIHSTSSYSKICYISSAELWKALEDTQAAVCVTIRWNLSSPSGGVAREDDYGCLQTGCVLYALNISQQAWWEKGSAGPWLCGYCIFIIIHTGLDGQHCLGRQRASLKTNLQKHQQEPTVWTECPCILLLYSGLQWWWTKGMN